MRVVRIEMAVHSQEDPSTILDAVQRLAKELFENSAGVEPSGRIEGIIENAASVEELTEDESEKLLDEARANL